MVGSNGHEWYDEMERSKSKLSPFLCISTIGTTRSSAGEHRLTTIAQCKRNREQKEGSDYEAFIVPTQSGRAHLGRKVEQKTWVPCTSGASHPTCIINRDIMISTRRSISTLHQRDPRESPCRSFHCSFSYGATPMVHPHA